MFAYITNTISNYLDPLMQRGFIVVSNIIPIEYYRKLLIDTNNYYNITDNVVSFSKSVENILTSQSLIQIYYRFSLMESLLLLDGGFCSFYFLRDFLLLKLSSKKLSKRSIVVYNEEIVDRYNSLYRLSTIDRYIFYLLIYLGYIVINYFYIENQYSYLLLLCITIPTVQNNLLSISFMNTIINKYIQNKDMFVKYSLSKMFVHYIQNLHPQIEKIQNYHIFIIYRLLSLKFVWNIIHNCLFISLLNVLRSYDSTYYYYKGIKMAYYYNIGYLYNIIPLADAIYLVNIIVKEKRWRELEKIEVVNAFFVLVVNKYEIFNSISNSFSTTCQIILFQVFSLYSIVSVLKILNIYLSGISLSIFIITLAGYLTKFDIKHIITSLLVYFFIMFNINDFIITIVIITHTIIYYCLEEIYFFIRNIENVKKVIRMYEAPCKEAKIRDQYVVC